MAARARSGLRPLLFLHVNMILAMYAGGVLVTAARLAWDPSAFVPARELWPREYRAALAALPAAGLALLLLALLAAALHADLFAPSTTTALLYVYIGGISSLMVGEAVWLWWTWRGLARWAQTDSAEDVRRAVKLKDQLKPVLETLTEFVPLTEKINRLVEEAEENLPHNGTVAIVAAAVYVAAMLAALTLAALQAAARAAPASLGVPPPAYQCEERPLSQRSETPLVAWPERTSL